MPDKVDGSSMYTPLNPDKIVLINFLRSITPMKDEMVNRIAQNFVLKEFKKGDFFVKEGKLSNEYLLLESGYMRAFLMDTKGDDVTVSFYSSLTIVFEVSSFFQRVLAQENIQALSDCKGWVITFGELDTLFHSMPEFREFGRAILVKGYVTLKSRTLSMINQTAEQRYASLLRESPNIFQNAPLKHIASYLGLTDTSLSRIRKQLSKKSFLAK
ncbi:MAG TPA: Crp/Fnr family transcriptional regulator [Chryseolinea sp.]|nr:Crp/Fnr family transcriptional regulator [Chryseolinea sp.]